MHPNERRKAVLGPGEPDPLGHYSENFHLRKGLAARDPINLTRFRQAERKFKKSWLTSPTDTREPIVTGKIMDKVLKEKFTCNIIYRSYDEYFPFLSTGSMLHSGFDLRIITFPNIPGLLYIPSMVSSNAQLELLISSMKEGMKPPAPSNLDILFQDGGKFKTETNPEVFSDIPKEGLFSKIKDGSSEASEIAMTLFRKYRWIVLGVQYDWTTKEYLWRRPYIPIPSPLSQLSIDICASLFGQTGMKYRPEAGIINYYQPGDTLTGHVDRSELDAYSPLISISLGLDCIFLVGGPSREDPVLPFCLSSGDVIILRDECRRNYHGVPLIIPGSLPEYFLVSQLSKITVSNGQDAALALALIKEARINLNIRQVWPDSSNTAFN